MNILWLCFFVLKCEFVSTRGTDTQWFCGLVKYAVFIVDKHPQDSSVYFAQLDFAQGLTQLLHLSTKVSLLTFDRHKPGELSFSIAFRNTTVRELTPSMWTRRTSAYVGATTYADLFPPKHGLGDILLLEDSFSIAIVLNVRLPRSFYLLEDIFLDSSEQIWATSHKSYVISIKGMNKFKTDTIFTKTSTEFQEYKTVTFKDCLNFQYNFDILYDDICKRFAFHERYSILYPQVNGAECLTHCEHRQPGFDICTITFFEYRWKVVTIGTPFFIGAGTSNSIARVRKAQRTCTESGMTPLIVRNQREAQQYGQYLTTMLAMMLDFHDPLVNDPYIRIMMGLSRSREKVGQRFHWGNNKELTFSHWAEKEPSGGNKKQCAVWKIGRISMEDMGWYSSNCGIEGAVKIVLCQDVLPPKKADLEISSDPDGIPSSYDRDKVGLAEFYTEDLTEGHHVTSVSLAVSNGLLQHLAQKHTTIHIKGLVHENVLIVHRSIHDHLLSRVFSLFYPCVNDDDTVSAKQGVPFSQVCDGRRDCHSGADETVCDEISYRKCSVDEFTCASRQCVSLAARCDLLLDCEDGSDERDCDLECPHAACTDGRCLPRSWFQDGEVDCSDGTDEHGSYHRAKECVFICNRTQCVTRAMLNDTSVDCKGPEGPLDETLGALTSIDCTQSKENNLTINKWAPQCVLFYDNFGEIIGCRNFQHLQNCTDFICPADYAKCPNSFCIPLAYISDGKQDCEEGQDESVQPVKNLSKYFRCHLFESQRVPLSSLCDNRMDCLQGEDELDCGYSCFPGFICLSGSVSGVMYNQTLPAPDLSFIDSRTRYLDLSGLSLPDFFRVYPRGRLVHLLKLNVSKCGIRDVLRCTDNSSLPGSQRIQSGCKSKNGVTDFTALQNIDLSHNKFTTVSERSYISIMFRLRTLDLSHNYKLTFLSKSSLKSLKELKILDLSFTGITYIARETFITLISLERLWLQQSRLKAVGFILPGQLLYFDAEQTNIETVDKDVFLQITSIKEIRSSSSKLCCPVVLGPHIPRHVCHSTEESVTSCTDLVKEIPLRVMLWLVCLATLLGNIITLLYRLTLDRTILQKSYGVFVTNLGVSDLLMGGYLAVIAVADARFSGEYVLHDHTWRHSHGCKAAGSMATLSSITSTVFVFLITVDRFLAVRYPFGEVRFTHNTMSAAVLGTWLFGVAVASLPLLPFAQDWVIYSNSGMCLGLPLKNDRLPGWQYSVTLFIVLNFLLFLFIGIGQGAIYSRFKEKGNRMRQTMTPKSQIYRTQRLQEFTIARQLSLVVMSNFLCWFPVITMGLMALAGKPVGEAAYRWSAVMVLPVNSALNPLLYTLPALKTKWEDFTQVRKQAKALARKRTQTSARSRTSSAARNSNWRKPMKMLRTLKKALVAKDRPGFFVTSNLKLLHDRVTDLLTRCPATKNG